MFENDIFLEHYGTPRHSGRYPWGSGEHPYQRDNRGFLQIADEYKKSGMTEAQIADAMGISTTKYRALRSIATNQIRKENIQRVNELKEKGYSNVEIGKKLGVNESVVRSWLKDIDIERTDISNNVANKLQEVCDKKGFIDVGLGVEYDVCGGVSKQRMDTALSILEEKGYMVATVKVEQQNNPGKFTYMKVLAPPGTEFKDIVTNKDKIKSFSDYEVTDDNGRTFTSKKTPPERPTSLDSDRIMVRYKEDGGEERDGLIELRRGVNDISLGAVNYAQVRVVVDGTHYMKGMAVYSDNMPDGVDVIFNSNKSKETHTKLQTMKEVSGDPDNPFKANYYAEGQRKYIDKDGNEKLSPINRIKDEGTWDAYSKNLSSQFLSKQSTELAKKQLGLALADKREEMEEYQNLTNPVLKKRLLTSFADDCDSSAVHLKAAALPRQNSRVLLPIPSLKDNEVYAPTYSNGEMVALIRHPHGGTFEIPVLKVNNNNKEGKSMISPTAKDAIGINTKVAARLSGADFDGDHVIVIPVNDRVKIKSTSPLKGLEGFNPTEVYGVDKNGQTYKGKVLKGKAMQTEMGKISNLITDMTLGGANTSELARAVRHSMVVIDAEKHKLDYQRSYQENGIAELKKTYQGGVNKGASTLISKASAEIRVPEYKTAYRPDPNTGEKILIPTGRSYTKKDGTIHEYKTETTRMAMTKDARNLSSGTQMENVYASYANQMKAMANSARKEADSIKAPQRNSSAAQMYSKEVQSLSAKLVVALKNAPRERQAQLIAETNVSAKKRDNPEMEKKELKKLRTQELAKARAQVGAKKNPVEITDKEWEAIQASAVSPTVLEKILNNTDLDKLKERATPRNQTGLSQAKVSKINQMQRSGYTLDEISKELNVSTSTVSKYIK